MSVAVATLEALDNGALAQFADRLMTLAMRSQPDFVTVRTMLPMMELPDALVARILSFMRPEKLALMATLSATFESKHVPAAVAERAARLELTPERSYQTVLDLLLGEEELAAKTECEVEPFHQSYSASCLARAKWTRQASLSFRPGEFVFSIAVVRCVFLRREPDDPDLGHRMADDQHVFYSRSSTVPSFPLSAEAVRIIQNPKDSMGEALSHPEAANVGIYANLWLTHTATRRVASLYHGLLGSVEEDPQDVEVTHLMPLERNWVDGPFGEGYDRGPLTKFYLNVCSHGIQFEAETGEETGEAETGEGNGPCVDLGMWSEVHIPGPWGGECDDHKDYGHGLLSSTLVALLRNIQLEETA